MPEQPADGEADLKDQADQVFKKHVKEWHSASFTLSSSIIVTAWKLSTSTFSRWITLPWSLGLQPWVCQSSAAISWICHRSESWTFNRTGFFKRMTNAWEKITYNDRQNHALEKTGPHSISNFRRHSVLKGLMPRKHGKEESLSTH